MTGIILMLLVGISASACATTMTEKGRRVREFKGETIAGCKFLGHVEGSGSWAWDSAGNFQKARIDMFNRVGDLGGNFVKAGAWTCSNMSGCTFMGEAYDCPQNYERGL